MKKICLFFLTICLIITICTLGLFSIITSAETTNTDGYYTYTISYDSNGGSGAPNKQFKKEGVSLTLSSDKPVRSGYRFRGWSTSPDGSVIYNVGDEYIDEQDITLYAKWAKLCSVCSGNGNNYYTKSCSKCSGKGYLVFSAQCSDHYTFNCRNCGGTGLISYNVECGNCYGDGSERYSKTCANCDGGIVAELERLEITKLPHVLMFLKGKDILSVSGGKIALYYTSDNIKTIDMELSMVSGFNNTIIGKQTLIVTYNGFQSEFEVEIVNEFPDDFKGHEFVFNNNWSCSCKFSKRPDEPQILKKTATSITLNKYEGLEYSINGKQWQSNNVFTNLLPDTEYTFYQRVAASSISYVSEPSKGLKVKTFSGYKISYNSNGGNETPKAQIKSYGEHITLTTQIPTRDGYKFRGWALNPDGPVMYKAGGKYTEDRNITLYAKWIQKCENCDGNGKISTCYQCNGWSSWCSRCGGYGYRECEFCEGEGVIVELESIDLTQFPKSITYSEEKGSLLVDGGAISLYYTDDSILVKKLKADMISGYNRNKLGVQKLTITYKWCTTTYQTEIKYAQTFVPTEPTLLSRTHNSVTLTENGGYEYSRDGINWQVSNVFLGLEPETEYLFYQRMAETERYSVGLSSIALTVKTSEAPECVLNPILHQYTNDCDPKCNICGSQRIVQHDYKWVTDKKATCGKAGIKHEECTLCEAKRKENATIAATGKHSYSNACDTKCNVCSKIRTITHSYETTTKKATTSKNGSIVKACSVCGKQASKCTIYYAKKIKLSTTEYTYNGKSKKPSVKVYDYKGNKISSSNYTVSYKNNKKVGKATVTIKLKGKYSGTLKATFKIVPKESKVSSLTAVKKSLKVKITKVSSQATGYEIQYSTSSKFKSAKTKKVTSYKTTSVTLKSLKSKKTYYVRVRTYKTVNGKKYYSDWSSYKYKKIK